MSDPLSRHRDQGKRAVLQALQSGNFATYEKAAASLPMAPATFSRYVQKLRDEGYIKGTGFVLDRTKLGFEILGFATVECRSVAAMSRVGEKLQLLPELQEVHLMMSGTITAKVVARTMPELGLIQNKINEIEGVRRTGVSIVMHTVKETTTLPV